jgi:hypothetical protein
MLQARQVSWNYDIAMVRLFQAETVKCLQEVLPEQTFKRLLNVLFKDYTVLEDYTTQYLDLLNIKFLGMDKEKRLKNLSSISKRLVDMGEEYLRLKRDVLNLPRRTTSMPRTLG